MDINLKHEFAIRFDRHGLNYTEDKKKSPIEAFSDGAWLGSELMARDIYAWLEKNRLENVSEKMDEFFERYISIVDSGQSDDILKDS